MIAGEANHNRKYEMQSVSQAFELLNVLSNSTAAHTLSYLSDCLGMSKNKMFRLLATLEQRGVVERFGNSWYRFGGMAFVLARRILVSDSVLNHARPIMAELVGLFNESVYLATYKNGAALLQDMVDCSQVIKTASFVGAEPSFLQETEKQTTPLFQINNGVLIDEGSLDAEITTVSAEFCNSTDSSAGALVVVAPSFRMTSERIQKDVAPALLAGVQRLSGLLGKVSEKSNAAQKPFMRTGTNVFHKKLKLVLPIDY